METHFKVNCIQCFERVGKLLSLLVDISHVSVLFAKISLLILYPKCAWATFKI